MALEHFELPRDDWYDSDGRIYKDALIENFNAIEAQLLELQALDLFEVQPVDWETVSIPDTTLASDNKAIVNLKSLANIMSFNNNLPVVCETSGKTVTKLEYYINGNKHTKTNVTLSTLEEGDFVWFKPNGGYLLVVDGDTVESYINNNEPGMLLGAYTRGELTLAYIPRFIDYDMLNALAKMKVTPQEFPAPERGWGWTTQDKYAGRRLCTTYDLRHAGDMLKLIMPDVGNKKDGTR